MASTLAFFDQMNGVNYSTLSSTNFQIGIVDPDSTGLTSSQLSSLESSGKTVIGYLSIGEAENFRSYWQSSWNTNPPSFLLGQDPNWPGDYNVKYWDPAWQQIVINEAVSMAKAGYSGIMMDVVDAYTVASVAAAAGGISAARTDMINFVEAISAATKAINPNFKIIQNNAMDLFTVNPDDPSSATNTAYLSHIDGAVAESSFFNGNSAASWSAGNVEYLEHAVAAGKPVLDIEYPTTAAAQQSAITQALADHFVPFVGPLNLDSIPTINSQIPAELPANALAGLTGGSSTSTGSAGGTTTGSTGGTTGTGSTGGTTTGSTGSTGGTTSGTVYNVASGNNTIAAAVTHEEFVIGSTYHGQSSIKYFGTDVGDTIALPSSLYSTAAQALSHVTYNSNGDAVLHLAGTDTITIVGAGTNSMVAADFSIYNSTSTGSTGGTTGTGSTGGTTGTGSTGSGSTGYQILPVYSGSQTVSASVADTEFVLSSAFHGHATINNFNASAGDIIDLAPNLFSTAAQALSHVTYSGSNAILHSVTGSDTITIVGVGAHSLVAADFHIG